MFHLDNFVEVCLFEEHLIHTIGIFREQDSLNHSAVLMQGYTIKSLRK